MSFRVDPYDRALVIEGWEKGIADSPFDGISNIRNADVASVPGEASVAFATAAMTTPPTVTSLSFTVAATGDLFTVSSTSGWYNGMAFTLNTLSGGTGLSTGRVYWVGDLTPTTFKAYANPTRNSGQLINVTLDGSGTLSSYTMGNIIDKLIAFGASSSATTRRNEYFFLDSAGLVWWVDNTNGTLTTNLIYLGNTTLTGTTGRAINYMVNSSDGRYLIVFRTSSVDALPLANIDTGNFDMYTSWVFAWDSVSGPSQTTRPTLLGQDNVLYFGNSGALGSFMEKAGATFDPSDGTTYTKNTKALDIPSGDDVVSLTELGINLLVGGQRNMIYPWDRVATSFSYPILLAENNVASMVTVNTNTYLFVGNRGNIYITNGSQANLFRKMPDHISGTIRPYYTWGGTAFHRNNLFFGVSVTDNAGAAISQYGGVWAIDLQTDALRLLNKSSYNTYAGYVTTILPTTAAGTGYAYFASWDSGVTTYGVDYTTTAPYTGSQATLDSDLIPIGTYDKPRDAVRIEYRLSKPLVSGESVSIYWRLDFSQSYTLAYTDSTVGAFSGSGPLNWKNAQWIQFQVVLNSTASSPSYTRLKEIRLTGLV